MEEIQEYIQLNLTFRIIPRDKENNHIKVLNGSKFTLKSRGIKNGREKRILKQFRYYYVSSIPFKKLRLQFRFYDKTLKRNWGFLNNEQSKKGYFWEIFKILEKGLIIIFLTFYGDQIIIKRAYVFTIVFIYQILTRKQYSQHIPQLNLIYELSTLIFGASKQTNHIIFHFYTFPIRLNEHSFQLFYGKQYQKN
ncbi:unnamed protein product [Paramecium pentaurelia]|uniref:Uncharacterized protein n=1 Tax=Paramecium pentaurelia TaxID=43138 RepID=A0A8S1W543_9CILI|nr:unnamed protein product [Paramecium pentaurelia]